MKKEKTFVPSVDGAQIFGYGCVSFIVNYGALWIYVILQNLLMTPLLIGIRQVMAVWHGILISLPMIGAAGLSTIYFAKCVSDQYKHSEGKHNWLRNFLIFVIPGEVVRLLIGFIDFSHLAGTAVVTIIPCHLFEFLYMFKVDASTRIRQGLEYVPADYFAYFGCYLLYLVMYCSLLMIPYYWLWKKAEFERNELIRYQKEDALHEIK